MSLALRTSMGCTEIIIADDGSLQLFYQVASMLEDEFAIKFLQKEDEFDSISWDYTGQFLLTGGPSGLTVQQYTKSTKSWSEPLRSAVPAAAVSWGVAAQSIVALNRDGGITVLGAQ